MKIAFELINYHQQFQDDATMGMTQIIISKNKNTIGGYG